MVNKASLGVNTVLQLLSVTKEINTGTYYIHFVMKGFIVITLWWLFGYIGGIKLWHKTSMVVPAMYGHLSCTAMFLLIYIFQLEFTARSNHPMKADIATLYITFSHSEDST